MSLVRLEAELARPRLRPDVELAVVLSVATRIEIELVRAVRLKVLPHLDVGAESDFWFSEWIGARQPRVVALRPDLLELLRAKLRTLFHTGALRSLRAVIQHIHTNISAALQLEEDVNWRACTGEHGGFAAACALLRSGTKAMAVEYRDGVAGWVAEARHRLPKDVMMSEDGWLLVLHAKYLRPDDVRDTPTDGNVEHLLKSLLLPAVHGKKIDGTRRTLAVRWKGGTLVLGGHEEGAVTIALPHHVPRVVELTAHGQSKGQWFLVEEELRFTPPEKGPVRLRTVDGRVFHIPDAVGDSVQASPVLIRTPGPAGEPARFWLQPVRFDTDERARARQPVALLGKVLSSVPVDGKAATRLRTWLERDEHTTVRLLHGRTEEHRVRLATQIAVTCSDQGWQVYRGRQDPEAAHWLDTTRPEPGPHGILLVVDRADTWHPQHLRDMLTALTAYEVRTRVLLLSADAGPWWQALTRTLEDRQVPVAAQPVAADRSPRKGPETYRSAFEVLAVTMSLDLTKLLPRATLPRTDEAAEPVAVAVVLDALTQRKPAPSSKARKVILRHEHDFLTRQESDHHGALAKLVFLATLLRPLRMQDARQLSFHFGLTDEEGWPALLAAYERRYSLDQDTLDPLGASQLRDDLLAATLVDAESDTGVDPEWARDLLSRLERDFQARAVGVLAHAAHRFPRLALLHLNPMVWHDPELLVEAGAAAIIAAIQTADTELLQKVSSALPAPHERDLRLDPAVARLEEVLVGHLFQQGDPGPDRDAPLHLRLARSKARAGLTEAALTSAQDATLAYRRLVVNKLRNHTQSLCESLILESELLGELGEASEAFGTAQDAERRLRELQRRMHDRPGANLGVALANLGRQKAKAPLGDKRQALDDLRQAVGILRGLAAEQPAEYRPELAEALVTLSERTADAGSASAARTCAEEAVELTRTLEKQNSWAHGYRLGAALLCLATWQEAGQAVLSTTEALRHYRRAASAAPDRFGSHLAHALTRHAAVLHELGSKDDALAAAEEAISLYERAHIGYAGGLAHAVALRDLWAGESS